MNTKKGAADPIWALGAMSGTSMDGVDAALVRTDGRQIFEFGDTGFRAFTSAEQDVIRAAQGKWPGEDGVAAASEVIETAHAELLSQFQADLVGFHGQTLAHDPDRGRTHQAGDGDLLANVLDTPVVWDFRSADVELGGQGAPLAPFFHFACAKWIGSAAPVVFLNLGGVGNMTWLDPSKQNPEDEGACLAFDTGPANALLDDLMHARMGARFDQDGALAASGQAIDDIVEGSLTHPYFLKIPPKSLDRNDFADVMARLDGVSDANGAATLVAITVGAVAQAMVHCPTPPAQVLVCGGGRLNPTIMQGLDQALNCPVVAVEQVGLNGDMLEAQAFAYLAVRVMHGLPTSAPGTTGVGAAVGGGRIARPA